MLEAVEAVLEVQVAVGTPPTEQEEWAGLAVVVRVGREESGTTICVTGQPRMQADLLVLLLLEEVEVCPEDSMEHLESVLMVKSNLRGRRCGNDYVQLDY